VIRAAKKTTFGVNRHPLEKPFLRIQPRKGWLEIDFGELWRYRDLCYLLVWRDLLVRYKQTVLGAAWAILQPLMTMIVFTIFFGTLAKIPSEGLPYPLFSYSALLIWSFFANSINQASNSLIGASNLVTKVYFPRIIMPAAPVMAGLVDLAVAFSLLLLLMPYYGVLPSTNVWALPIFIFLALIAAMGVGIWLAALNVKYRDFRYVVPFLTQFWMFVSPVVYPSGMVPDRWRLLYALNPMTGPIEGFRWALLGTQTNPWPLVAVSAMSAAAILALGVFYFQRTEEFFADLI
jgi:lipopolysaccharide transport system permease protein